MNGLSIAWQHIQALVAANSQAMAHFSVEVLRILCQAYIAANLVWLVVLLSED